MNQKPDSALQFTVAADKLHGVYPQKQTELYMQRIKIPGGMISWPQWRTVAQIQKSFSPDTPVHLTTRQDIELHNLCLDDVINAMDFKALREALIMVSPEYKPEPCKQVEAVHCYGKLPASQTVRTITDGFDLFTL